MKGKIMDKKNDRKESYKKLSCEVTKDLAERVDKESHKLCITKSEYIRRAIREYLEE